MCFGKAADLPAEPCFQRIAVHPVATAHEVPEIHSLQTFDGKIYLGYGAWLGHPGPVVLYAYDPNAHTFTAEHSLGTDSIGAMRVIDDKLWIASIDPVHYQRFTDYSVIHRSGRLEQRSPVGFFHTFDLVERENGELWITGSKDANEWPLNNAAAFRSFDRGESWEDITPVSIARPSRYYWGFDLEGRLQVQDGGYFGTTWQPQADSPNLLYKATTRAEADRTVVVVKQSQIPGSNTVASALLRYSDSASAEVILPSVYDFTTTGTEAEVWVLGEGWIRRCSDYSTPSVTWETFTIAGQPATARAIEVHDGVIYLGTTTGELWAARIDGQTMQTQPTFGVRLQEQFGRAIAIDGDYMAVGAPQATAPGAPIQSGRVLIYQRDDASSAWQQALELIPPVPTTGGFFGDAVALLADDLAILESATLESGERGKGAVVHHFHRQPDGSWQYVRGLPIAFAQSVAMFGNYLYVGEVKNTRQYSLSTGELVAANLINVDHEEFHQLTIGPRAGGSDTAHLISGVSGDVSRNGAPGVVAHVPIGASGLMPTGSQITSSAGGFDRFGFDVDCKGGVLVVGAPRADDAGSQAGVVCIYRENAQQGWDFEQNLSAPDARAEDGFGHAVSLSADGTRLLIGAPMATVSGERRGAVYDYQWQDRGGWQLQRRYYPPADRNQTWEFGDNVVIDGSTAIIAAGQVDQSLPFLQRLTFVDLDSPPTPYEVWLDQFDVHPIDGEPTADANRDGTTNLEAYALGFDPTQTAPVALLPTVDASGSARFIYRRRADAAARGLTYSIETSDNLQLWQPLQAGPFTAINAGWQMITTELPASSGFARLRIKLLP